MAYERSAGVYTEELDESSRIESTVSSICVIVGEAKRGEVNKRTYITTGKQLKAQFGIPDARIGYALYSGLAVLEQSTSLYFTRVAPGALYGGLAINWSGAYNTSASWAAGVSDPAVDLAFTASTLFHVYAIDPGDWNKTLFIRVYPDTNTNDEHFYLEVWVSGAGNYAEKWRCTLNYEVDGTGTQLNVEEQINNGSAYIQILQNHEQADYVAATSKQFINTVDAGGSATDPGIQIAGGASGRRPTTSELIDAWDLYADKEEVTARILINAGYTDVDYQTAMIELCESRKDCIAILDIPSDKQTPSKAIAWRRNVLMSATSYGAVYTPDVYITDPDNGIRLYVPCSGYVAARYCYTDENYAEWFAVAGMLRGDLNVKGLRHAYELGERDALDQSQINPLRIISGEGIKIWGANTLQVQASALQQIPVRRLMITLEVTIENALLYSVFDPNDRVLWSAIKAKLDAYLQTIKDGRGLYGFSVVCDESNNTSETIAAGDLFVDIYVDPVIFVKRIFFNVTINKTGVSVTATTG